MTKQNKQSTEAAVRDIRRRTRRKFSPEEKIRIVLEGLRGEQSVSDLCRREGIASNLYYRWTCNAPEAASSRRLDLRGPSWPREGYATENHAKGGGSSCNRLQRGRVASPDT